MERAQEDAERLLAILDVSRKVVVLGGAGCSTDSGIPDYRGPGGTWTRHKPIYYQDFLRSLSTRRFYWARSFRGWSRFHAAEPNQVHRALAALESHGKISFLITQNVDRLHQRAGSLNVLDLHGRNDLVRCIDCGKEMPRLELQRLLAELNPGALSAAEPRPDGDAVVSREESETFRIVDCGHCGGPLKPAVVFFGESIPRETWASVWERTHRSDLLLVLGSSLATGSALRIVREATAAGAMLAIVNAGPTRGDDAASFRSEERLADVLSRVVDLSIGRHREPALDLPGGKPPDDSGQRDGHRDEEEGAAQ